MGYHWDDESTWGPEPEERWWHVYLHLMAVTFGLPIVLCIFGPPFLVLLMLCTLIMSFVSFCAFLAQMGVYGLDAKAGGFFWAFVTCALLCKFIS